MNSKIKTFEWIILFVIAIVIDLVQIGLDFFVVGLIANRIIDAVVLVLFNAYLWFRGVSLTDWKKILAQAVAFIGESVPVVDILPLWSLDVVVMWIMVVGEKKLAKKLPIVKGALDTINKVKGITQPRGNRPPPLNSTPGTRLPNKSREYDAEDEDSALAI